MTRIERFVAAGVFLMAFVCVFLAGSGPALAQELLCSYQWDCELIDPNNPDEGMNCHVFVFCAPSTGDCDQICDDEVVFCYSDCLGEGGTPQSCTNACVQAFLACVRACIPQV